MAVEIQIPWTASGDTLYAIVRNAGGAVYNGSGFEAYDSGYYDTYAVPLVEESSSRCYMSAFPPVAAGIYHVAVYRQVGGFPVEGDDPIDHFTLEWTGSEQLRIAALLPADPAAALLDRADGVETSVTLRQALRLILAALAGPISGADTSSVSIKNVDGSKTRIVASVDAAGNRTSVTIDPT